MNNMRRGFTMIELVFVIVIIGILAAVALPRFTGISDDAHVSKLQSFVGTLNRTAGPSMWSGVQRNEQQASLKSATGSEYNTITAGIQVESIPSEITGLLTGGVISMANCRDSNLTAVAAIGGVAPTDGNILTGNVIIGDNEYMMGCMDSNLAQSPVFYLFNTTSTPANQIIMR